MTRRLTMFQVIEQMNGDRPWGAVLDAGTGVASASWLARIGTRQWTAVSADPDHLAETRQAIGSAMRRQDRLIAGNWADPQFLAGEQFDTVIADYLLGAVEGYAPYFQSALFARLRPLIRGRVYVVGVDPYVFAPLQPDDHAGHIVQQIARLRDGCATLAGVRPYREYPAEWVMDQLERNGLRILDAKRFPNAHDAGWVTRQAADIGRLAGSCTDIALRAAMESRLRVLVAQAGRHIKEAGALISGHDYVIAAEVAGE